MRQHANAVRIHLAAVLVHNEAEGLQFMDAKNGFGGVQIAVKSFAYSH